VSDLGAHKEEQIKAKTHGWF